MSDETKTCIRCKEEQPIDQFPLRYKRPGTHSHCKSCKSFARRLRRYNTDAETIAALLAVQLGSCGICDGPPRHIDHDHKTGRVRGVLCPQCNVLLGMAQDNPDILASAIRYLKRQSNMEEAIKYTEAQSKDPRYREVLNKAYGDGK